jgi:hypothetical protein
LSSLKKQYKIIKEGHRIETVCLLEQTRSSVNKIVFFTGPGENKAKASFPTLKIPNATLTHYGYGVYLLTGLDTKGLGKLLGDSKSTDEQEICAAIQALKENGYIVPHAFNLDANGYEKILIAQPQ